MNIERTLYITLDIDWANDEVLEYSAELLNSLEVTATIFVTHATPVLGRLREKGFELGIHPNFNHLLEGMEGATAARVIHDLKDAVPEAVSVRSHSVLSSIQLSQDFRDAGFTHESNYFVPSHSGITLLPYEQPEGLIQTPYNWGDYSSCQTGWKVTPDEYLECPGLKVMNFHPIHLYLNTDDLSLYHQAKGYTRDVSVLNAYVNKGRKGTTRYFEDLVKTAKGKGVVFDHIKNITL